MQKMPFPDMMTSGFNFDEAITMAELCRRVYKVFENQYTTKPKELYEALYEDNEWEFIHSISDYKTDGRALILKRKDRNQFAVVFRGTIFTSGGFEFTGQQENEDIRLAEYDIIPGEATPPSNNVRVYAGMMNGFKALRDQVEFFFDILFYGLNENHVVKLIELKKREKMAMIEVMHVSNLFKLNKKYKDMILKIKKQKSNDIEVLDIGNIFSLNKYTSILHKLEDVNVNDVLKIKSLSTEIKQYIEKIELNIDKLLKIKLHINTIETHVIQNEPGLREIRNEFIYQYRLNYNNLINKIENFNHYSLDVMIGGSVPALQFIEEIRGKINKIENPESKNIKNVFFTGKERYEIYMAGHSRGAGLATFAALYLKRYFNSKKDSDRSPVSIKKYSIGSTKVGNKDFVEYYNEQMKGFSYRIQNLMDFAIYFPLPTSIPFPYNLQLMVPGIEYVREGELYHAYYEHVGEPYTLFGLGNQNLDLGFGGPLNLTIPVPFSHGPDGYKEMLIEARERRQGFLRIFGDLFNIRFEMYEQAFQNIYEQSTDLEQKVDEISKNTEQKIEKILEILNKPPAPASAVQESSLNQTQEEGEQNEAGEEEEGTGGS